MEVRLGDSLRPHCTIQGSTDDTLSVWGVLYGTKHRVECDGVDYVLVKDFGRDFTTNHTHHVDVHRLSDLKRPGEISDARESVGDIYTVPDTGVLSAVSTPATVDGTID